MLMNSPHTNQMENVKLTVKPEIIEGITKKKFKEYESNIKEINTKCTVCQACFEGEDDTRILNCNHVYHTDCIDNWLANYNYLCPCCREPAAEHFANLS
jgi:tRNA A37 threonylcarbamoyladenosine dehydratase